ncbi:MAG: succinylglutamate desuccinylase [Candidatus Dactylopiibacterium carminicum]|uniref:Succinylglutamate desuccinylase n=1 Tax=Candidatus Dactylopiibacterium carminicum TaxID=857335 RepID=A0A272EMH9_9RHOO|nr:succinylglutamate desuccinylase/aspartoacylase family protein [Candidatus Dactylopiibacterium carminicum]KAF7597724.1 succinylglutamate desuccinylase [Candidatus Dactylopiibacterium carminicum]PAS91329.1 MAG: succinylglutamate desuccinylase [Candidatus Dactylopiibacterium carminicum]PAS92163.1 MAG: succinylglutamate desuccinylase [Candidatus Dactylopiibacterium carminicum]PAS94747.1 MAG: succinylglutamate desuccinylase [Candidatus Dactylopiibacterium carminicum]
MSHPVLTQPSTTSLRSHTFHGLEAGPKLLILGAVHGNEVCGTRAIERLITELDSGRLSLARGQLTVVPITNPLAYHRKQRNGDRNLNRNLRPTDAPEDFEDRIANALCPLLAAHDVLLDLHSFLSQGQAFAMLGPQDNDGALQPFTQSALEEKLVLRLGVGRVVEGWLDTYARGVEKRLAYPDASLRAQMLSTHPSYGVGTTEYMRAQGGCALTLECGQHEDPAAPEVAYAAIRNALAVLGLLDEPLPPAQSEVEFLRLEEVIDRLHPEDGFAREWKSFDSVREGELIGTRHDGKAVTAPADGYIVFPNGKSAPGNEWFYFARPSTRRLRA